MDVFQKRESRKASKEKARQKAKEYPEEYFSTHPCVDCGETDPIVLTFDHVQGGKRGNVADMVHGGWGLQTVIAEIEKCDVVCYNCHSIRTQQRSGAYRFRTGKTGKLL